jgi:hypothetical protein
MNNGKQGSKHKAVTPHIYICSDHIGDCQDAAAQSLSIGDVRLAYELPQSLERHTFTANS